MRGLAYKRHHEQRIKRYAFYVLKYVYSFWKWERDEDLWENARKRAHTMASCSAYCCGNPRKFFNEKTIQERKAEIKEREERRCIQL